METKIIKFKKEYLYSYPQTKAYKFLYVTKQIWRELEREMFYYSYGSSNYMFWCIDYVELVDDIIDFLKPEEIYYKEDYVEERKYDCIKIMQFIVKKMEGGEK